VRVLAIVHDDHAGPGVFADATRALGAELVSWDVVAGARAPEDPLACDAVITLGGAMNTDEAAVHPWIDDEQAVLAELVAREVPVLAVCLGAQMLAEALGGSVRRASESEIGWFDVEVDAAAETDPLLGSLAPRFEALEWHHYEFQLPPGAVELARSARCLQAYRFGDRAWGIQFHPEVTSGDFAAWVEGYRRGEDTGGLQLDPDALLAVTQPRIGAWNKLGRQLCERFIAVATR
jgi:GMP synthase-like glutamine amidotransferase